MASVFVGSAANTRSIPSGSGNVMAFTTISIVRAWFWSSVSLALPVGARTRGWRAFRVYQDHRTRDCGSLRCNVPWSGGRLVQSWRKCWLHRGNRWHNYNLGSVGNYRTSYTADLTNLRIPRYSTRRANALFTGSGRRWWW
jgi:hypothetical protein